jgi:sarcosine oxidase subunit alpha
MSRVTLTFDGERIPAEEGEPIASALVRAGKLTIARSPKFHRPRGPACFRGACDGCLARVDGEPNVMTCLEPAHEGCVIESQNTLGAREMDLLRVTDWFFAQGLNHHELFAGVPGIEKVMQMFARRVAGLGKIPEEATPARKAERREIDVLVVGAGPSGMNAALELAKRGRDVEVVHDDLEPGGVALALDGFDALLESFTKSSIRRRARTIAAAIYGDDVLVAAPEGASIVHAKTVVLAPGAHDGVLAFEGNDLPGVMSARAACWLARREVTVGKKQVAVVSGEGRFAEALSKRTKVEIVRGEPVTAKGSSRVKAIVVRTKEGERTLPCDALFVDAPSAPAYELCAQAGAKLRHEGRGYVVTGGKIREGFFVVGEATGAVPGEVVSLFD